MWWWTSHGLGLLGKPNYTTRPRSSLHTGTPPGLSFFSLQRTPIGLKRRKEEGVDCRASAFWCTLSFFTDHAKHPPLPPNHHHLNPYMWLCTYSLFRWDGLSQVDCSHNVTCIVQVQHNTWKTLLSHGWRVSAAWNPVIELRDICAPLQSQSVHYCQPKAVELKRVNQVIDLM